jgi:hypothetical protein
MLCQNRVDNVIDHHDDPPTQTTHPEQKPADIAPHPRKHWGWDLRLAVLGIALAIPSLALGIPSILSKLSVSPAGTELYRGRAAPAFIVSNEGSVDVYEVTALCWFRELKLKNNNKAVPQGNVMDIAAQPLGSRSPGKTATVVCPIDFAAFAGEEFGSGLLTIVVSYEPILRPWPSQVQHDFEARDDTLHWVPQPLY